MRTQNIIRRKKYSICKHRHFEDDYFFLLTVEPVLVNSEIMSFKNVLVKEERIGCIVKEPSLARNQTPTGTEITSDLIVSFVNENGRKYTEKDEKHFIRYNNKIYTIIKVRGAVIVNLDLIEHKGEVYEILNENESVNL